MPIASAKLVPQFGSNTRIALPNAASDLVDALRLLLTFTENTPGGERSKWTLQTAYDGVLYDTLSIRASVEVGIPSTLFFLYDTDTGIERSADNTIAIRVGGNRMLFVNASGALLRGDLGSGIGYQWAGYDAGTFFNATKGDLNVKPHSGAGNVNLGLVAGALATAATSGFFTVPTCNGTPTGIVDVPAGQMAIVLDSATSRWFGSTGGGVWTQLS